ncbi:eCIS core domain-containing protein [Micromonospora yangpuensis]|uniref:eCIS core domain-containing protein n=1 Tax=Micromonospora yangpuensis TaxID=683228 RepID=A0A1C6TWG2_9ACTN|nr:DUF4157 domain-containing protein [Micromonospora yangpuensis]GGM01391.1 hypothetical protein GCM10012279_18700 [Micromonospora yangpuensis]SCL46172.1 protein of unknown function [Micromonospora yangpuensis]
MRQHRSEQASSTPDRPASTHAGPAGRRAEGHTARRGEVARSGRPGVGRSPQEIIGLQRTIGNRAVARAIEEDRHEHAAGCAHPPAEQVQRSVASVLGSSGRPLDDTTRADMESRLGSDFSDVRIHDDSAARSSAAGIGARAYTSGNHVVLGEGGADRHTLAHELTHVIQQRLGPVAGTDNGSGLRISDPGDRFEREAEATARRVLAGAPPAATEQQHTDGPTAAESPVQTAVQRVPKADTEPTSSRQQPYPPEGRRTRGKVREEERAKLPPVDPKQLRLRFRSAYDGPDEQELDTKQDIGFTQTATLIAPANLPRNAEFTYDFRQFAADQYVYWERQDDETYKKGQRTSTAWRLDGPYHPPYDDSEIDKTPTTITFRDAPGWSRNVAMTPGSWLASYTVRFRWEIKLAGSTDAPWVSDVVSHTFTSPFDRRNPAESGPLQAAPVGSRDWDVTLP